MKKNWQTTVGGILLSIGLIGQGVPQVPEEYRWIFLVMASVGGAWVGISAKQYNTHSTEAEVQAATKVQQVEKKLEAVKEETKEVK